MIGSSKNSTENYPRTQEKENRVHFKPGLSAIRFSNNWALSYCWFSHDVTKIQTKKLSILPRFYFHDALKQLKTNFHANFRFQRVLEYAWVSKLLRDAAFT